MKIIRGVLFVLLGLTALMQGVEGIASIADPASALDVVSVRPVSRVRSCVSFNSHLSLQRLP
jgi:hypothetical protein